MLGGGRFLFLVSWFWVINNFFVMLVFFYLCCYDCELVVCWVTIVIEVLEEAYSGIIKVLRRLLV